MYFWTKKDLYTKKSIYTLDSISVNYYLMKMQHKKHIIPLIFLTISGLMFTQIALNRGDKIISSNKSPVVVNTAQLTEINYSIYINNNSDWGALSGNSWFQGSGTFLDPYIISNITIISPRFYSSRISIINTTVYFIIQNCALDCISIINTTVDFIIQNCALKDCCLYLANVEKGLIYNNELHKYGGDSLVLRDCYNVSIVRNNAIDGFSIRDSEKINVSNNVITDAFTGISLSQSSNCSIWRNEIRLTDNYIRRNYYNIDYVKGILMSGSHFNTITENHFYCIPNPFEYWGSNIGNVIENNFVHSCVIYNPMTVLVVELLISSILMVTLIIPLYVVARKYPRRKKMVGIVSTAITLGIMGLLGHGAYNWDFLVSWDKLMLGVALIPLIGVNLAILILSIKLIIKASSGSQSN